MQEQIRQVENIGESLWSDFFKYFEDKKDEYKARVSFNIARKLSCDKKLSDREISNGIRIIDILYSENSNLFSESEHHRIKENKDSMNASSITIQVVEKMSDWENKANVLSEKQRAKLFYIAKGFEKFNDFNRRFVLNCLEILKNNGYTLG